jgi:uncharacterized protein YeaO (DUF488 family)
MVRIKRVYEPHASIDGARYLVERLWPRGVSKASLAMYAWMKDAAPSTALRQWFDHDVERWAEFRRRYRAELNTRPEAWGPILAQARRGRVTLLFSAHDLKHNNAVVLRDFLNARLKSRRPGSKQGGRNGETRPEKHV